MSLASSMGAFTGLWFAEAVALFQRDQLQS